MSTFKTVGCEDLAEWLVSVGFKVFENHLGKADNLCNWIAVRKTNIDAFECECNEGKRVQLVVTPYHYIFRDEIKGVDVDLTGEAGGIWYKLQAYSLKQNELLDKLPMIEESLVAAWNALNRGL